MITPTPLKREVKSSKDSAPGTELMEIGRGCGTLSG